MAILITLHCVRNTIIEDYHTQGKLSDEEMKEFNKEVVNRIYSFIELLSNPELEEVRKLAFKSPTFFYKPVGWDEPQFDERFKKGLESLKSNFDQRN